MDIFQLQYFRAVAETGSFTRAAEALHLTQSALSKSIAKLEDEIGLRLFEREGNRITLNRFGQQFLQDTGSALTKLSDSVRAVREMAGLAQGEVRIAISKDIFVDHLIKQFLVEHPDVSFYCYLLSPEQMRDALDTGAIDLAVTTNRPEGVGILWQDLYLDQLEVLISKDHPLARYSELHLDQLRNERFVVTNSNYNMENVIESLCHQAGFVPHVLYNGMSTDMPMHFVANGDAVMITPRSITAGVREVITMDFVVRSIPLVNEYANMRRYVGVAFKEGHYQSAAAQEFFEQMLAFYSELSGE